MRRHHGPFPEIGKRDRRVGRVDFAGEPVAVKNAVGDLAGRDAVADGIYGLKAAPVNA